MPNSAGFWIISRLIASRTPPPRYPTAYPADETRSSSAVADQVRQQRFVEHDAAGDADVADHEQDQREQPVPALDPDIAAVAMTPIPRKTPSSRFFIAA